MIKTAGVIIDPLQYSEPLQDTVNETVSNYHRTDIRVSRIVSGTVDKYVKLPSAEAERKDRESKIDNKPTLKKKTREFTRKGGRRAAVKV